MPSRESITLPVIVGPTGVGKTAVAIRVTETLGGEIISADSRQSYSGMAIGSGAPSADELARVPHHLLGVFPPHQRLSAGEFAGMARGVARDIAARGKIPIVVGGSGLYIRALIDGLVQLPAVDNRLRREIETEIERYGMGTMIDRLREVDPDYGSKVGPRDRKRLVRALEVWRATGIPFSAWHDASINETWCTPVFFGLSRPRFELLEIIEKRSKRMIEGGWIGEIENLATRYGGIDHLPPAVTESLGYQELIQYLQGRIDKAAASELIIIRTRQFAKRQMTWFRADKRICWMEACGEGAIDEWTDWVKQHLLLILICNQRDTLNRKIHCR